MMSRNETDLKCEVRTSSTKCFCYLDRGNCWDFNEVLATVYIISRDKTIASVPIGAYKNAGNIKMALENIEPILNGLHKNARTLSKSLFTASLLPNAESIVSIACKSRQGVTDKDAEQLVNRGDLGIKIVMDRTKSCIQLFSRGTYDVNKQDGSSAILRIREKIIQQINFCEAKKPGRGSCKLELFKKKLPEVLEPFLRYQSSKNTVLETRPLLYSETKNYFDWKPNETRGNTSGFVFAIVIAAVLMFVTLFIIRTACSYQPIDERKQLNPQKFKLKDIEKELKKALLGKKADKSVMTIQAKKDLDKALKADRKRQTKRRGSMLNTVQLPTPKEESDLGSTKNKNKSAQMFNLQKTQHDFTEFIGTAIEPPRPKIQKQARHPIEKNELSVPSRTDQGTFVNKEKSDEVVNLRSLQKTQSVTPEMDALPVVLPNIEPTPRNKTPLPNGSIATEAKRTKRKKSTSKSASPEKVRQAKSKMVQKEKKNWYRFWS